MIWVQNSSSVPQNKALCHKTKLCATTQSSVSQNQSSVPQTKANYPRIRHKPNNAKSAAFCSFCVFAGKNAVYLANQSCKDGESKALCHKLKLCATKQSSVPQTKANYPRIRHKTNNAKSAAFCSFCVFAGKNAVYLANQSCKDGKSSHVDRTKVVTLY